MRRRLLLNYTSHATRSYDDDEICKVVDFLKKYPCSQIRLNDSYKLGFMTDSQIEYLFDNALNNLKITMLDISSSMSYRLNDPAFDILYQKLQKNTSLENLIVSKHEFNQERLQKLKEIDFQFQKVALKTILLCLQRHPKTMLPLDIINIIQAFSGALTTYLDQNGDQKLKTLPKFRITYS